jgi:opacity protein-like surface antigen
MVESWTGFYVGGGGGIGILNTDLNSSASRTDDIGFCKVKKSDKDRKECEEKENGKKFAPFLSILQSQTSSFDLGDEGFFGTVQLGYDKQFAPRWVIGGFVDADWYSDLKAKGYQETSSALNLNLKHFELDLPLSKMTTDAQLGLEWTFTAGGRLGWLATPSTLLYVLGAYTHAQLDNSRVNVFIDDPFRSVDQFVRSSISKPTKIALAFPDSLEGFSLGGGAEAKLGGGPWAIKLEYRWSHFEGDSASGSSVDSECYPIKRHFGIGREIEGTASSDFDDVDLHTVRGVLTYRFGGAPEVASLK